MAVMAARLVSGGLSCGMTMQPSGRPVTVACSDQVAARVDEVIVASGAATAVTARKAGGPIRMRSSERRFMESLNDLKIAH